MNNTDTKPKHYGMPGVGGSLGKCAVCGETFVTKILLGQGVESFSVKGIPQRLYGHDTCMDKLREITSTGNDWRKLPPGPLRKAFEEQEKEKRE